MKILISGILLIAIALAGCASVKTTTYTFTKDRVDQVVEGNRGYLLGTPPALTDRSQPPKRTMIGIDVEIGVLPAEEAYYKRKKIQSSQTEKKEIIKDAKEDWIK